jgi:hypothetical protein
MGSEGLLAIIQSIFNWFMGLLKYRKAVFRVDRLFFCDDVSEGQFGKGNFIGYIPGNQVAVAGLPYILESYLVMEGTLSKQTEDFSLSVRIRFRNTEGVMTHDEITPLGTMEKPLADFAGPVVIPAQIRWEITELGEMILTVLAQGTPVFERMFNVVSGEAPRSKLTPERLELSGVLGSGDPTQLKNIVSRADRELILVDRFLDASYLLKLLKNVPEETKIKVLADRRYKRGYEKQSGEIISFPNSMEIRFADKVHDRLVIVNGTDYFHFGHSLKGLGKKISRYSKVVNKKEIEELKQRLAAVWQKADSMRLDE